MWIDTHCHLDFIYENKSKDESLFDNSLLDFIICPSANHKSFNILKKLNQKNKSIIYAFGYHPLYLNDLPENPIQYLENEILNSQPIAVGEIGLDFYLGNEEKEKQKIIFQQQLELASKYKLPVILHVRSAIDDVLKILKDFPDIKGIAHAFNGSFQQAQQFINMGFKLGFGGAMTYSRAKKINRLALELPIDSIVLETDAPDMKPVWVNANSQNHPNEIRGIAEFFAQLRNISVNDLSWQLKNNIADIFPDLGTAS